MKPAIWTSCYDQQWSGVITPQSFAHPAKYSRALIERIYHHCLERGYLKKGDLVGDCFGGIGTGGIMAAYAGLRWIGVELEPRFVAWANENFALHGPKWAILELPSPTILQGDSRQFDKLIHQAAGVISSPPFTQGYSSGGGINIKGYGPDGNDKVGSRTYQGTGADRTSGNIESLPCGDVAAAVSSPPYQAGLVHGNDCPDKEIYKTKGLCSQAGKQYGVTDGQIGRLQGGDVQAVVSSPPYATDVVHGGHGLNLEKFKDPKRVGVTSHALGKNEMQRYGQTEGNIGNDKETYWQAMRDVYAACFRAIKPAGVLVLVLKDYVKNKQRVPLSDDTVTLCKSLGFILIERVQAMLVSETKHADLFTGVDVKTKSRKSFFRRLAESKGSPKIDHEDVLFFRRP